MKILHKIINIKHYIAAYRLQKENQRRKELMREHYERSAFEYLSDWENNKNNESLLYLRSISYE